MPKALSKTQQKKVKDWLKGRGHDKALVDTLSISTSEDLCIAVLMLHGITPAEYAAAGGKA